MKRARPDVLTSVTRRIATGCGNIYITITEDENGSPFEVFTSIGKAGGCAASQAEAIGRLISLALRSNIDRKEIIKQLKGVRCHKPAWNEGGQIFSCADAIARALESYKDHGKVIGEPQTEHTISEHHSGACPECGGAVEHEGGCEICHNCGYTKCA